MAALSHTPLASFSDLGRRMGVSGAVAAARVRDLIAREILYQDFVKAQISYSRVGLELVACLISSSPKRWGTVERACDLHPYTRYRIRIMGSGPGLFVLFAAPYGTLHLLESFLEDLMGLLGEEASFQIYPVVAEPEYHETDFSMLTDATTWRFDWQDWMDRAISGRKPLGTKRPSILHRLNAKDLLILRELSINYRRERKTIAKDVKLPTYALSKRLRFFHEERIIVGPRLSFNRTVVGLLANCLFLCRSSVSSAERAAHGSALLPFQSALFPIEGGFLLHLDQLPPQNYPHLATFIEELTGRSVAFWCDYTSSDRYYFDNEPTNLREGAWRSDREFLIDDILSSLNATEQG